MRIKSLHAHRVKIPVPGRDPIIFMPGEEKEVSEEIGEKLKVAKGFMVPQAEAIHGTTKKKGGK